MVAHIERPSNDREQAVLLFGGTTEGRQLAEAFAERGRNVVCCIVSQVGAEQLPKGNPYIHVRVGALEEQAIAQLAADGFAWVVDATHPYAVQVSANVRAAAGEAGVPYVRVVRPQMDTGGSTTAASVAQACTMVPAGAGNVLAVTGSKEIDAYAAIDGFRKRVFARVLPDERSMEACRAAGLPDDHIITGQGPFSVEQNVRVLREHGIRWMITKESGDAGGFPQKLTAAQECGCEVIVVRRPQDEDGLQLDQVVELLCGGETAEGVGRETLEVQGTCETKEVRR